MSQLTPTPGAAWRKPREQGEVVTLPSGNVARLRPVALDQLMLSGKIPDLLTPIAAKSLWTETDAADIGDQVETAKGFAELVNLIVPAAMIAPRIVEVAETDDEITLADIDFGDKIAIFQLATGGSQTLRLFREQQEKRLEPVSNGEDVRAAAEPNDGDYRPVDSAPV